VSIITVLFFLLIPISIVSADLEVSGAGNAAANGCYVDNMSGEWVQESSQYWIANDFVAGDNYCILIANGVGSGQSQYFNNTGATICDESVATADAWSADAGSSPAPTVTQTTCTGGGGGEDTNATSTINQIQENLYHGIVLFFLSMFGMIWLLRKH